MFAEGNPEVLVVGAGPVGLFAALHLAKQGITVEIVDSGVWACKHSYALALYPQTLNLLREVGVLDRLMSNAYPVRNLALCDRNGTRARVRLGDASDPLGCLAVVRQDVIEDMLEHALREAGVAVHWRHDISALQPAADHVTATVDRLEKESRGYVVAHTEWVVGRRWDLQTPFVLGADGYNSRVRRTLNIEYPEVAPAQYYAVFEFETDAKLGDEAHIVFGPGTSDVLWPLPGNLCRWSFQLTDYHDSVAEEMKDRLLRSGFGYFPTERPKDRNEGSENKYPAVLDEKHLTDLIAARATWFHGSIEKIHWRTVVRFEHRLAASFGQHRTWLAGDAAHLAGPVAVQSMNIGLFEAHEFSNLIAGILRGRGTLADLDACGDRWHAEWRRLQGLEAPLQAVAETDPWIAEHAVDLPGCLPGFGAEVAQLAAQIGLVSPPVHSKTAVP
ncbi:NAD(P)/FAD-dependent oxidoreductase [uncultured Paludibaculum sp.]|uniref:FAD-dependent oxidoreductase n=1 Tax=uncultured Paludibaculum sp. TaxID=1765020 RepID=UPI002AAA9EF2|nr:NAD(P)/FAD-dependent oxidoreductase [uncultured Paludibaculum sp.]